MVVFCKPKLPHGKRNKSMQLANECSMMHRSENKMCAIGQSQIKIKNGKTNMHLLLQSQKLQ
jgi:hypothetical protein